jgi:hypothetical protein
VKGKKLTNFWETDGVPLRNEKRPQMANVNSPNPIGRVRRDCCYLLVLVWSFSKGYLIACWLHTGHWNVVLILVDFTHPAWVGARVIEYKAHFDRYCYGEIVSIEPLGARYKSRVMEEGNSGGKKATTYRFI